MQPTNFSVDAEGFTEAVGSRYFSQIYLFPTQSFSKKRCFYGSLICTLIL